MWKEQKHVLLSLFLHISLGVFFWKNFATKLTDNPGHNILELLKILAQG